MQRPRTTKDAAANEYIDFLEEKILGLTQELAAYEKNPVHIFYLCTQTQLEQLSRSFSNIKIKLDDDGKEFDKFIKFQERANVMLLNIEKCREIMKKGGINPDNDTDTDISPESYVQKNA